MKKGLLKSTNGYSRAKDVTQIGLVAGISLLVLIFIGLVSSAFVGNKYVKEFKDTAEYRATYVQKVDDVMSDYQNGKIDFSEANREMSTFQSFDGTAEMLKESSNEELKTKYEKVEKAQNGLTIAGIGVFGASVAACIIGPSFDKKSKKREEKEMEEE